MTPLPNKSGQFNYGKNTGSIFWDEKVAYGNLMNTINRYLRAGGVCPYKHEYRQHYHHHHHHCSNEPCIFAQMKKSVFGIDVQSQALNMLHKRWDSKLQSLGYRPDEANRMIETIASHTSKPQLQTSTRTTSFNI